MQRKNTTPYQTLIMIIGCLLFCSAPVPVKAFHIIGGEITYRCMGPGDSGTMNYTFVMTVYRDCAGLGAQFDNPAEIGIYEFENGTYTYVQDFDVAHGAIVEVPPPDDPCLLVPSTVCVQRAVYDFNLNNLKVIDGSYIIFWRRCCRNESINNIIDPRNVGATFSVEITASAQLLCNESPTFKAFPPTVICVNQPLMFDHSAVDAEGDQLVYEFCAPLEGGGPVGGQGGGSGNERACNGIRPDPANCPPPFLPVAFVAPTYTALNPLSGNPKVTIDANTGLITGIPTLLGQFVVGVCVKEYRNGELLSVLQRDFQFNVSTCEIAVEAEIESDTTLGIQRFVVNSCGDFTVDFVNLSQRETNIVAYEWKFDLGNEIKMVDTRHASVTFPGLGTYLGTMIINKGLTCTDTAEILVNVFPEINSDFEFEYDTCFGAPVEFTDKSFSGSGQLTNWYWNFGDNQSSQARNPNHLYPIPGNHPVTLRVRDINACEDVSTQVISYFPVPPVIIVEPSTFNGCAPASIKFNNLSIPIDETYDILWDFGDGSQSTEISPTHTYENEGVYSLHISITSPIGCYIEADFGSWINVRPSPEAGFSYTPDILNNFNSEVFFTDQSIYAAGWQWTFGDEGIAFVRNPTHMFIDTGIQHIQQVVFHVNGCTDTAYATIDVIPEVRYYLPNAFTPNFDSKNDSYKGVGIVEGMTEFEMSIWSRWGEQVFRTTDPRESWNGRMENTGEDLPPGVYVCVVKYRDPRNNPVEIKEFATLIR
ncbi:MAG TPA: PKD domain-containing protein [Saprospiraceae bacterium]|nr:PKD domain-containing protein [Saprospiraceae bacterium]